MDRLTVLAAELNTVLTQLRDEAARRDLCELTAPLAWLDESYSWLKYELAHLNSIERDPVPFTYIPVDLRR